MSSKILIIGACGQIGSELTYKLREINGDENVIASDISYNNLEVVNSGIFEIVDAQDYASILICVEKHKINTIYLMAAMLSATGEKYPMKAWDLNYFGLPVLRFLDPQLLKIKHHNILLWNRPRFMELPNKSESDGVNIILINMALT